MHRISTVIVKFTTNYPYGNCPKMFKLSMIPNQTLKNFIGVDFPHFKPHIQAGENPTDL